MRTFCTTKPSTLHPERTQEDYLFLSKKYPIFAVADGVTLRTKGDRKYPDPSGAAKVAEIFCKRVILEAEKKYDNFITKDLKEIFKIANKAIADYNESQGITKKNINYYDVDFFSATAAFLLIKDKKAYWFSLCDSGIILLNKSGKRIFSSPSSQPTEGKFLPKDWSKKDDKERSIIMHGYRNKLGKNKELLGYGVADGQEGALNYLNFGEIDLDGKELAIVYTDGFEHYLKLDEFNKIFLDWPKSLEDKLEILMDKKIKEDKIKYGLERSLVAILLD